MTDEQLDRVYREYFRREAPVEMPPLPQSEVARPGYSLQRQLSYAAAVAAMLIAGIWMASQSVTPTAAPGKAPTNLLNGAEADGLKLLNKVQDPPPEADLPMP